MRISPGRSRVRAKAGFIRKSFFAAAVLIVGNVAQEAMAQAHELPRPRRSSKFEAENFSAASEGYPFAESCEACSGQGNLGYYWKDSWFEFEVNAARMLDYRVSLRAASPTGTEVEVLAVDEFGETSLGTIRVRKTGSWTTYRNTPFVSLSLPAGVRTLRFRNLVDGANVDFVRFRGGRASDVLSRQPTLNAGPDINPMKGFNSGWWRPNDDYASVGFQYIEWGKFEPEDDKYDWDYVDEVLNRAGSQGRHVIVQFAVDWDDWGQDQPVGDSHYRGPDWLLKKVGENRGPAFPEDPNSRISRATRYNDPEFVAEATEVINALFNGDGTHPGLKNDPRSFVLQVGILGYWGEWHTFPRNDWAPSQQTKATILDVYLSNLGSDGLTQVRYPEEPVNVPQAGMGYTNGSVVLTEHGREFGRAIAAGELWKNGPVGGEWPPNVGDKTLWEAFFADVEGLDFILEGRYSTVLAPEFDSPNHVTDLVGMVENFNPAGAFLTMHKAMGYNFQVKRVSHMVSKDSSGLTHFEVDLCNAGIAPFYKDWAVQLAVLDAETGAVVDVVEVDTDLRTLGPNDSMTLTGSSDATLAADGQYKIGLRILQPHADQNKTTAWKLNARNTYVVLANDIEVIDGEWDANNALQGGWNILNDIQP